MIKDYQGEEGSAEQTQKKARIFHTILLTMAEKPFFRPLSHDDRGRESSAVTGHRSTNVVQQLDWSVQIVVLPTERSNQS